MKHEITDLDEIYTEIGQELINLIPDDFKESWIRTEISEDAWSISIFYKKPIGTYGYINDDIDSLEEKIKLLHSFYKDKTSEPWSSATFHLINTFKMSLNLGYEDISDFGKSSERRETWIKNHLGEDAKIDWY